MTRANNQDSRNNVGSTYGDRKDKFGRRQFDNAQYSQGEDLDGGKEMHAYDRHMAYVVDIIVVLGRL